MYVYIYIIYIYTLYIYIHIIYTLYKYMLCKCVYGCVCLCVLDWKRSIPEPVEASQPFVAQHGNRYPTWKTYKHGGLIVV